MSHIKTPTLTEEVCITHFCVHLEMFQTTCLYVNVSGDCCSFKAPRGQPILTGLHGRYGSEPNLVQVLTSNSQLEIFIKVLSSLTLPALPQEYWQAAQVLVLTLEKKSSWVLVISSFTRDPRSPERPFFQ